MIGLLEKTLAEDFKDIFQPASDKELDARRKPYIVQIDGLKDDEPPFVRVRGLGARDAAKEALKKLGYKVVDIYLLAKAEYMEFVYHIPQEDTQFDIKVLHPPVSQRNQ